MRAPGVLRCGCPGLAGRGVGTRCSSGWAEKLGKKQNSANFVVGRVGIVGEGLDPLAKHQIHGPKQPNLTRSNKLQEKFLGLFLWGFSNLDEKQQNQASKWGDGTPRCESTLLMIPRCCRENP